MVKLKCDAISTERKEDGFGENWRGSSSTLLVSKAQQGSYCFGRARAQGNFSVIGRKASKNPFQGRNGCWMFFIQRNGRSNVLRNIC